MSEEKPITDEKPITVPVSEETPIPQEPVPEDGAVENAPEEDAVENVPTEEDSVENVPTEEAKELPREETDAQAAPEELPAAEDAPVEEVSDETPAQAPVAVKETRGMKAAREAFDFVELFVLTLVAVLVLTSFFFRHSVVDGGSMMNTLQDGEHLIISDFLYHPKAGDIVVIDDYSLASEYFHKPLVKRVIATEGQTVEVKGPHEVYVDGELVASDFVYLDGTYSDAGKQYLNVTVPEGCIYVMGDHRNNSSDSRTFGCVEESAVLGKVILRFYPFDRFGTVR